MTRLLACACLLLAGCALAPSAPAPARGSWPSAAPSIDPARELEIRIHLNALAEPGRADEAEARLLAIGREAAPVVADSLPRLSGNARARAARVLGSTGDASVLPILINALDAQSPEVLEALRRISGRDLGSERRAWTAWWTEEAARLPDEEHRRIRDQFLRMKPEQQRDEAIKTVRWLEQLTYTTQLLRSDANDANPRLQRQVEVNPTLVDAVRKRMVALPVLEGVLFHPTPHTAIYAAPLAKQIGRPAVPLLDRALRSRSSDGSIRLQAAQLLGELAQGEKAPAALAEALSDPEEAVRREALRSLGNLRDTAAIPAVETAARSGPAQNRAAAHVALLTIDPQRSPEPLLALLGEQAGDGIAEEFWQWARSHFARSHDETRRLMSQMDEKEFLRWLMKQGLFSPELHRYNETVWQNPQAVNAAPRPPVVRDPAAWRRWWEIHRTCKEKR